MSSSNNKLKLDRCGSVFKVTKHFHKTSTDIDENNPKYQVKPGSFRSTWAGELKDPKQILEEEVFSAEFEKPTGKIQDFKLCYEKNNHGTTGLFIRNVQPHSSLAGVLEPHDQLIKVNDLDVKNLDRGKVDDILEHLSGTIKLEVARIKRHEQNAKQDSDSAEQELSFVNKASEVKYTVRKQEHHENEVEQGIKEHLQEENIKITHLQRLQNENTALTSKMKCLEKRITKEATTNQCLTEENTDLVFKMEDLKESNNQIKEEKTNLIAITHLLQEESRRVEETVPMAVAELQLREYVVRTDQLEQQIGSLNNQKQQLRQEMENQIQQLLEENIQQNNDTQRHAQLEKDLIEKEKQQLQEAKNSMESQIQQLQEENTKMKNEIQQHVDDNRKKDNDIWQLQQEKDLIEQEKDRIEQEKQQLQELKSSMEIQMAYQIQQLRQEKNDMEHKNLQLQKANREKDNKIQEHEESNRNLSNEIEQLQEQNDNKSKELQSLRLEISIMEIQIKQLQENTKCDCITKLGTVTFSTDDILGKGGWGAVYKGNFYGTEVAVKEYYEVILSDHNLKILEREIKIASQCRHPNLLQMICATKNEKNCLLIVTELMDMALRTLLEHQAKKKLRLELSQIKSISLDVARGLNYLHLKTPNAIIHRDVSSANVLLWMENGSVRRAKISDYGSANFTQACNTENPGAPLYAAPEAKKAKHSPKIDVFSYGLLVCETYNCELPHPEPSKRTAQIRRIKNGKIKRLVIQCIEMDPQQRPTMQKVIGLWEHME